jgi:hypothetical protein
MSQLVADPTVSASAEPSGAFRHSLDPAETEFAYRPIPMSAIIGGVLAVLSTTALLMWLAIPLAVLAAIICLVATITILRSRGEFAGLWVAGGGLAFSVLMAVAGTILTMQRYRAELPPGYERVSFARDIAAKGVGRAEQNGQMAMMIPKEVMALQGKPIYLKGYIYPSGREYELTQFVLCKDNAQCCFGGQPALQDMIGVTLNQNKTTNYTTSLTGVAGKLKINPDYHGGDVEPIYLLEADYVAPAQTSL